MSDSNLIDNNAVTKFLSKKLAARYLIYGKSIIAIGFVAVDAGPISSQLIIEVN